MRVTRSKKLLDEEQIESIIQQRQNKGQLEYLVKLKSNRSACWESSSKINAKLIQQFKKNSSQCSIIANQNIQLKTKTIQQQGSFLQSSEQKDQSQEGKQKKKLNRKIKKQKKSLRNKKSIQSSQQIKNPEQKSAQNIVQQQDSFLNQYYQQQDIDLQKYKIGPKQRYQQSAQIILQIQSDSQQSSGGRQKWIQKQSKQKQTSFNKRLKNRKQRSETSKQQTYKKKQNKLRIESILKDTKKSIYPQQILINTVIAQGIVGQVKYFLLRLRNNKKYYVTQKNMIKYFPRKLTQYYQRVLNKVGKSTHKLNFIL